MEKKHEYSDKVRVNIVISDKTRSKLSDIAISEGIFSPKTGKPSLSKTIEVLVARYTRDNAHY